VLGLAPGDVEGKTLDEVFPPEAVEVQEPKYRAALDGKKQLWIQEYGGRRYRMYALPVRADGDERRGMIVSEDVTDLPSSV
jgi:PAS domain-containing protein